MGISATMTKEGTQSHPNGITTSHPIPKEASGLFTTAALTFVASLERQFREQRMRLLERRAARRKQIDNGLLPDFLFSTAWIRNDSWSVGPIPKDLLDRRVELVGPVDRKSIVDGLNSGANVYIADFEDSTSPTWENIVLGQVHVYDAVRQTIGYRSPDGKEQTLKGKPAVLMVCPRGLHSQESGLIVDGQPVSAALFDFGFFFFHNARELLNRGSGPYFYLPKVEFHHEARFWNELFVYAQNQLGIPRGSIRATVTIDTLHAAFEMDEILYELREHSTGLACHRWNYIFSCIKTLRNHHQFVFPDRSVMTMNQHFLRAVSQTLVQTCHKRRVHALGGPTGFVPSENDPTATRQALKRARLDKEREALDGHDGTRVAHPAMVSVALGAFNERMRGPNQIHISRNDIAFSAKDFYDFPRKALTHRGFGNSINITLQFLAHWLLGIASFPVQGNLENTATAEVCRTQLWHWLHHPGMRFSDSSPVTERVFQSWIKSELTKLLHESDKSRFHSKLQEAALLLDSLVLTEEIDEYLTVRGQDYLRRNGELS